MNSVDVRLAQASEAYQDAMDALRLYSARRPEWKHVLESIEGYVDLLQGDLSLHEPGT
jgi:hypothetical protein